MNIYSHLLRRSPLPRIPPLPGIRPPHRDTLRVLVHDPPVLNQPGHAPVFQGVLGRVDEEIRGFEGGQVGGDLFHCRVGGGDYYFPGISLFGVLLLLLLLVVVVVLVVLVVLVLVLVPPR